MRVLFTDYLSLLVLHRLDMNSLFVWPNVSVRSCKRCFENAEVHAAYCSPSSHYHLTHAYTYKNGLSCIFLLLSVSKILELLIDVCGKMN